MDFTRLKKNLKKDFSAFPPFALSLLGDSATQLLAQAIRGYGYEMGANFRVWEADFDQIDRQILDPGSELYAREADFTLVFPCSEKLLEKFYRALPGDRARFAAGYLAHVRCLCETALKNRPTTLLYCNFPEIDDGVFGNFANKTDSSFPYQLRKINAGLMDLSREIESLFVIDLSALQNAIGRDAFSDRRLWITSKSAVSLTVLPEIARSICQSVLAAKGRLKKCLILDLDNTLWGGIVGDDGWANLEIGDLGTGCGYTDLQRWALALKQRGIILAVCSKNDEANAKEPFLRHPEMVLKLEDFAVFVANWESKAANIQDIRSALNIGFDTMVFLDDSPFERGLIRRYFPEITVPELPEDPADFVTYLRGLNLFETASFSEEDAARTESYRTEARRLHHKESFASEAEYLGSLGMTACFAPIDAFHLPRAVQLLQRSNQFNLRTVRYSAQQLADFASSAKHHAFAIELSDQFGDYGLISVAVAEKRDDALFIDTWVMSCRVLKRGVENLLLNALVERAKLWGAGAIIGEYKPTAKNTLVKDLYKNLGFADAGGGFWRLDIAAYQPAETHIHAETPN